MSQIKIQVLAAGEVQSGSNNGRNWHRKTLQIFAAGVAANHIVYADDPKELEQFQAGIYMADLVGRAGNNGRLEFSISSLTPAQNK